MKHILIFLSLLIVATLAYVDAKERIEELDEVAANTPAQVEMKQNIKPATPSNIQKNIDIIQPSLNDNTQKLHEKIHKDSSIINDKFNSVKEKRKTITTPIQ